MIKVIRKVNIEEIMTPTPKTISQNTIPMKQIGDSFIFLESIKPSVMINYNIDGEPDKQLVDLGTQFDHRVSFLEFDLENLLWNKHKGNTKYGNYTFKLAITNESNTETSMWEFDGESFEVPRKITKNAGTYTFTLIIEEYQKDDSSGEQGNIKISSPYFIERFVCKPFKGQVFPTGYRPEYDITLFEMETDQLSALTKPSILCSLTDSGILTLEKNTIGEKLDNFVTYFKFNPETITGHLNDFTLIMTFKNNNQFCCSLVERTSPTDEGDIKDYPAIVWVPSEVYQTPGEWTISVIGFVGNIDHINDPHEYNGDYYFYVSKEAKVIVSDNILNQSDVNRDTILSVTLNLLTSEGDAIITADDGVYVAESEPFIREEE